MGRRSNKSGLFGAVGTLTVYTRVREWPGMVLVMISLEGRRGYLRGLLFGDGGFLAYFGIYWVKGEVRRTRDFEILALEV